MKSSPAFKLLSIAVLAAIVVYFGVQVYQYFSDPFATTLVYASDTEDAVDLDGWIVCDEETFHYDSGTLYAVRNEGEKVGKGQTIAYAYESKSALDKVAKVEELQLQLEQLEYAQASYLDDNASLKLDGSIISNLLTFRQDIAQGDYTDVSADVTELKGAIMKRDYADYGSVKEISEKIHQLKDEIGSIKSELSGATAISAPKAGTYSGVCDGYEDVLTLKLLKHLTPSKLTNVTPKSASANVGKLVYGESWYYAATVNASYAERFHEGESINVRLAKGFTQDLTMKIRSVSKPEDGKVAVVFETNSYLAEVTALRHQLGQAIFATYDGLRIPSTALRVADGQTGVYCVSGANVRFKPVDIVYQGDSYVLVASPKGIDDLEILRVGDEVIITASDIADGDVLVK